MSPSHGLSTVPPRPTTGPTPGARERLIAARDHKPRDDGPGRKLTPGSSLLDANEAAKLLGVPPSWMLAQARAQKIPHHKIGRYTRFDADELIAWVERTKIEPR